MGKKFRKNVTNINLNILKYLESTSLHLASLIGHLPVVQLLLDRGADIDQKNDDGEFTLFIFKCFIIQLICLFINLPICQYIWWFMYLFID